MRTIDAQRPTYAQALQMLDLIEEQVRQVRRLVAAAAAQASAELEEINAGTNRSDQRTH